MIRSFLALFCKRTPPATPFSEAEAATVGAGEIIKLNGNFYKVLVPGTLWISDFGHLYGSAYVQRLDNVEGGRLP